VATTTPNYGWPVPTSTDLVKDGAVAIEALGDAIDATVFGLGSGGMTLLSTTTLSGASVTISSIPQTYQSLEIWIYNSINATSNGATRIAPNGSTNLYRATGTASVDTNSLRSFTAEYIRTSYSMNRTDANNFGRIVISNYASTANYKGVSASYQFLEGNNYVSAEDYGGGLVTNSAITSLVISNSGGNFSGGTVKVFGIK
jgi:hypothetical protein